MRANATNFGGYLGPYYNFFLAKILESWVNPFMVKKGRISKMLTILTEKETVFRFFRASSVTISSYEESEKSIRKLLKTLFHEHAIRFRLKSIV